MSSITPRISPSFQKPIYTGQTQNPQVGTQGNLNGQHIIYERENNEIENNNCFTRFCVAIMNLCCQCCKKPDRKTPSLQAPSLQDRAAPIPSNNDTVLTILSNHGIASPVQGDRKEEEEKEVHFVIGQQPVEEKKSSQPQNEGSIIERHNWIGTYDPIFNPRNTSNNPKPKNPRLDSPRPSFSGPSRQKKHVENEITV